MSRWTINTRALALLGALFLFGCEAEKLTDSSAGTAAGATFSLIVVSGNNQTGTVGLPLPKPIVVKVVDKYNKPVRDQIVNFVVVAGGGSVFAGVSKTNPSGIAQEIWTLGTVAGSPQKLEARYVDATTGSPVVLGSFTATAIAGPPVTLTKILGDNQPGLPGLPLPDSLKVQVADRYGNLVIGATVTWSVTQVGGSISPASSVTSPSGVAAAAWTNGNADGTASAAVGALAVSFNSRVRDDVRGFITYYRGPASGATGAWNIYRAAPDGSGEVALLSDGYDNRSADVSPDGTKILFSSNRSGVWAIHTMNADGSNISPPLRVLDQRLCCAHARWSPDGSRIAFMDSYPFEIWVMDANGNNARQVTAIGMWAHSPSWSPDGKSIAFFELDGQSNVNIYRVNADGSGLAQLTRTNKDQWLSWCSSGRIAFQSERTGESGIYMMDGNGGNVTRITPTGSAFVAPACSPTGNSVAFSGFGGPLGIWRAGIDGSNLQQIVAPNGYQIVGSWW